MLSLNLILLDQFKFLLNVFILISLVSAARFIHVYVFISQPSPGQNGKKMIIAVSLRAIGGASDLLHDCPGGGASSNPIYCIYSVEMDLKCLYLKVLLSG